jgi:hypothetical protein
VDDADSLLCCRGVAKGEDEKVARLVKLKSCSAKDFVLGGESGHTRKMMNWYPATTAKAESGEDMKRDAQ